MKRKIIVFVLLSIFGYSTYCQITRDSAITIVKNRVLGGNWADKEIYASAIPIDTLLNVNSNNISRLCKYWYIFVDEQPYANWGHPCKDIFIDVTTGVVHSFNKKMPPSNIINMDIIHRVCPLTTTKSSQLFKIPKPNHPRNVTTSNNEYAVIISGGYNKFNNRERYWNDCSVMYQALVNVYNYDKDKIFVLMADGTNPGADLHLNNGNYISSPLDLDGDGIDDIQYSATDTNITFVFDSLSQIVTDVDNVFVFVTDHGGEGSTICLWNEQVITSAQFAAEINKLSGAKTINVCMEQCYSGGYITALAGNNRVIATACAANETSWSMTNRVYDEFCYHWISAVVGMTPSGVTVNADYDNDGFVSMDEAFLYARNNDYWYNQPTSDPEHETPQYYSNKQCLGQSMALNGVFNASCLYADLYIRDTTFDYGVMPCNVVRTWESPDIWIEDMAGNRVERPAGNANYNVCVRVHNRSNEESSGREKLFLNWAKAGVNDYWSDNWTDDTPIPFCEAAKGGYIGNVNGVSIPIIPSNSSTIVKVPWLTPISERYRFCSGFNENIWHFCLLARVHDCDEIAHENEQYAGIYWMVRDHNNVAQRNVNLNKSLVYKTVFSVNNPTDNACNYFIRLLKRQNNFAEKITDFAEISLSLEDDLLQNINYDMLTGAKFVNDNTLLITDENFTLPITLSSGQYNTMETSVNFLTNKTPQNDTTYFDIIAYTDEDLSEIAGGQSYHNIYTTGRTFHANAGNDTAVLLNTNATLHATQINEDATYRWYDKQRNFKYEGMNYSVVPTQTSEYILEVTAESDGYRDLDTVKVTVVPGCIRSITPNPVTDNWVTVSYEYATTVTSAQLLIYNTATTTLVGNYDLSNLGNVSSLDIEVTNYPTGSYTVVLVCDNSVCHSKVLIRQ